MKFFKLVLVLGLCLTMLRNHYCSAQGSICGSGDQVIYKAIVLPSVLSLHFSKALTSKYFNV